MRPGSRTSSNAALPPLCLPEGHGCELAFESYGLKIGISLYDPGLLDAVIACLPPGWAPIASASLDRRFRLEQTGTDREQESPPGLRLTVDGNLAAWALGPDMILASLESHLQQYVAEFSQPTLFVHSGVVRWKGTTIMLPGTSFSGKSTLVAALVEAGAVYYSDEYAVLDHDGCVLPYTRRLSLRAGPLGVAGRLDLSQHGPQGDDATRPVPVDLVLLTRFKSGMEWTCEALDLGPAMLALCEHTVAIQRRPADAFAILGKVAERARVYRGGRGDLGSAVTWLDETL